MERISLDESDVRTLSREILATAVKDWKQGLECGAKRYGLISGASIDRDELLEFFFSDYFKLLCSMATQRSPKQIRRALGIPHKTYKEAKAAFDLY